LPDIPFIKLVYNKLNNYFQIPYAEGFDEKFQLNFNAFCETYKLNPLITFNAFRVLDQNSVFALSEAFFKKTTLRFLTNKEQLLSYLGKNRNLVDTVQTILRTYGGVFEFDTKINTVLIAKKAGATEKSILKTLRQLKVENIIAYEERNSDLELTFLVPREDDVTINVFAHKVKALNATKVKNIENILTYINNTKVCRSKQLLHYFGEKVETNCGKCDICKGKLPLDADITTFVSDEIVRLLKTESKSSRELIKALDFEENTILISIRELLESGKIRINTRNEYELGQKG
jgi:ATP-dependent DNA helicase RecQ